MQSAFIGGEWTGAATGATLAVEDPATGTTIGTIPDCGAAETRDAIAAASAGFAPGAAAPPVTVPPSWNAGTRWCWTTPATWPAS